MVSSFPNSDLSRSEYIQEKKKDFKILKAQFVKNIIKTTDQATLGISRQPLLG